MNKEKVRKNIKDFFKTKHKPSEVKKIKKFAMHNQIKLKDLRKKFCKKCCSMNLKTISVKKGFKRVICKDCGFVNKYKIKKL